MIGNPVAGTLQSDAAATTSAVPYPASPATGDLLIIWIGSNSATAATTPAGWTLAKTELAASGPSESVFYKFAAGGETGTVTVTHANVTTQSQMYKVSGVDQTTPVDVTPTSIAAGAVATYAIPTLTPTRANNLLMTFGITNNATATWAPPTSPGTFTELVDSLARVPSSEVCYLQYASASATGTVTLDASTTVKGAGILIAWRRAYFDAAGVCDLTTTVVGDATKVPYVAAGVSAVVAQTLGTVTAKMVASGTSALATTVTGNATKVPYVAAGVIPVVSGVIGDATISASVQAAAGVIPVVSGVAGTVTARMVASGTSALATTVTGAVTARMAVSGTSPVVCATSGAPKAKFVVSGTSALTTTVTGAVTAKFAATSTVAAIVTVIGNATLPLNGQGVIVLVTTVTGDPQFYSPGSVQMRLILDRGTDDHAQARWPGRRYRAPFTQTALLLYQTGEVVPTFDFDPWYANADDVAGGGVDRHWRADSWQVAALTAAGYSLEPVT